MILKQNPNAPEVTCSKHCWKMMLNKNGSQFVQQHLRMKVVEQIFPEQRIDML